MTTEDKPLPFLRITVEVYEKYESTELEIPTEGICIGMPGEDEWGLWSVDTDSTEEKFCKDMGMGRHDCVAMPIVHARAMIEALEWYAEHMGDYELGYYDANRAASALRKIKGEK